MTPHCRRLYNETRWQRFVQFPLPPPGSFRQIGRLFTHHGRLQFVNRVVRFRVCAIIPALTFVTVNSVLQSCTDGFVDTPTMMAIDDDEPMMLVGDAEVGECLEQCDGLMRGARR